MSDREIEEIEIRLFLEAIQARYGYDLREYAPSSMRRRVLAALASSGLAHLGELQHRILRDRVVFAAVLDDLTVRVTEMFRDPPFYRAFRSRVIPILRTYPLLRLWHSGCASGEEVYASAIVLLEERLYARTQLYGTDLSAAAIEHAKEGVYPADRAALFGENYAAAGGTATFGRYLTEAYGRIAMRDALKRNILFFPHSLVSDHVFGEMQVVFCRNVLIYFTRELRRRVLDKIAESLCPGGFLCLGVSEQLAPGAHPAFSDFAPEHRIYRRAS